MSYRESRVDCNLADETVAQLALLHALVEPGQENTLTVLILDSTGIMLITIAN